MAAFSLNHHLLHGSIWKAGINMLCQCVIWNTYVISASYDTHAFEHFSGLREIPIFYSAGWAVQGTLERAVSVLFFWPRRVWDVEKTAFSMISLKNETFDNCSSVSDFSPLLFLLRLHSLSVETIWCHAVKKTLKEKNLELPSFVSKMSARWGYQTLRNFRRGKKAEKMCHTNLIGLNWHPAPDMDELTARPRAPFS